MTISLYAKAIVALFAAPLTYVAQQLLANQAVSLPAVASYCITAVLVWAVPNAVGR